MLIPAHILNQIDNHKFAVTVGFFDGLHLGHQFILNQLKKEAEKRGLKTMVFTFKHHPQLTLNPSYTPELLSSFDEKIKYLKDFGIDEVIAIDFTREFANLTAAQFVKNVLFYDLRVRFLLVGHDHRFGKNREEGFPEYQAYGKEVGMEVQQAERFTTDKLQSVSSTNIREALKKGDMDKVNELLNRPYSFVGQVIDGFKVGRKIGFPTANLKLVDEYKIIPPMAVYAVQIEWNNQVYKGMMNIGKRPTVHNSDAVSLEVHIINFDEEIYHQDLEVKFIKKIRNEKKFNSMEDLIEQLKLDKQFVMTNI